MSAPELDIDQVAEEIRQASNTMPLDELIPWAENMASYLANTVREGRKYDRKWATQIDLLRTITDLAPELASL